MSMNCPKCGFENLDEASFCIKCGARIDGKIPCPKCGEYISNDEVKCPHCGKLIPHKKESDIIKNNEVAPRKEKIANVFNRVSTFVTLFLFIFFLIATFTVYSTNDSTLCSFDFLYFYKNQFNGFDSFTSLDKTLAITRYVIFGIDMLVTWIASVFGIKMVVRAFKERDKIVDSYKFLAIIIGAKLTTLSLIIASLNGANLYYADATLSLLAFAIVHFVICLAFNCFQNFKRGAVSIFIARIILAVGVFLPIISLASFSGYYFANGGFLYHYLHLLDMLVNHSYSDGFISVFVLGTISFVLAIIIIALCYQLIVYFSVSYFRGMVRFKRFRIIYYLLAISISISSTGYLISSIVEFALYQKYLGEQILFVVAPIFSFVCSVLLVGVAIATFSIYNRANRRALLEERTTVVE